MSYNLTILERMILECLSSSSKSVQDLQDKTKIRKDILNRVLESLVSRNIVLISSSKYSLNTNLRADITKELNNTTSLLCEVNEVINSCVRSKLIEDNEQSFKLKKVNMSEREEKIYNGLLYNLESFLGSLSKNDNVSEQKIIFWGEGRYEDIKNSILNF